MNIYSQEQYLPNNPEQQEPQWPHTQFQIPINAKPATDEVELFIGMGCFWGAERKCWQLEGVVNTSVGYAGGETAFATYEQVCSGQTGHSEVVRVVVKENALARLFELFWQSHDATSYLKQGNDIGSQYRTAIYAFDQKIVDLALTSAKEFQPVLNKNGYGSIQTEIKVINHYYYAEAYHQQYLDKNPNGYCGLKGLALEK